MFERAMENCTTLTTNLLPFLFSFMFLAPIILLSANTCIVKTENVTFLSVSLCVSNFEFGMVYDLISIIVSSFLLNEPFFTEVFVVEKPA